MTQAAALSSRMLGIFSPSQESNAALDYLISFGKGVISLPADMYYTGKEYLDTEHRGRNSNDTIRLVSLIERGRVNRQSIEDIVRVILAQYINNLSEAQRATLLAHAAMYFSGNAVLNYYGVSRLVALFVSQAVAKIATGMSFSLILAAGASRARAIYSAYALLEKNPEIYWTLRNEGDLDLRYFLVERQLDPWLDAIAAQQHNSALADELFAQLLEGM